MGQDQEKQSKPLRVLIVDGDAGFTNGVIDGYNAAREPLGNRALIPIFVDTVRTSQAKLSDRDFDYAAVFVNPSIGTPAWFAVARSVHQYRSGTPIFVIYDEKLSIDAKQAQQLGLCGALKKPLTYEQILESVNGESAGLNLPQDAEGEASAVGQKPAEAPTADTDYIEVALAGLSGRVKSQFDLFVRLSNGKYVRVLSAGDALSADRIESYRAKGLTQLFILATAQADYLKFFDNLVNEVVKDTNVSIEVKAEHVGAQGKNTIDFLKKSGFSEASMAQAQQYVSNSVEIVNQIAAKSDLVKQLLDDVASYEHSLACSTLAGLLIKHIGGSNPAILNAIGTACFLHDIALVGQPPAVLTEDESKMTPEQVLTYRIHPDEGARLIKKMKNVPAVVATAVGQHHLRMNGGGFPAEKAVAEVNRIAELIGVCHEFMLLLEKKKTEPTLDPYMVLRVRADKEFSAAIVDAFVRTFESK